MIRDYIHTSSGDSEYDLFVLQPGQSNNFGQTGSQPPTRPELIGDINNAFIWDVDDYKTLNFPGNNQGDSFACEMSLAYNFTSQTGRQIYIDKIAVPGTAIYQESGNSDWNVASNELIVNLKDAYQRLINKAQSIGSENPKFVMIWIQGERDARVIESQQYYANFTDILNEVNSMMELDLVILNVLNSQLINSDGFVQPYLDNVINHQLQVARDNSNVVNLDMNDFQLGLDLLHYPSESQELIGDKAFDIIDDILV